MREWDENVRKVERWEARDLEGKRKSKESRQRGGSKEWEG